MHLSRDWMLLSTDRRLLLLLSDDLAENGITNPTVCLSKTPTIRLHKINGQATWKRDLWESTSGRRAANYADSSFSCESLLEVTQHSVGRHCYMDWSRTLLPSDWYPAAHSTRVGSWLYSERHCFTRFSLKGSFPQQNWFGNVCIVNNSVCSSCALFVAASKQAHDICECLG